MIFKGHYIKCTKLLEDTVASGDSTNDRLFIKFIESDTSANRNLRFFISQNGVQWYVKFPLERLQDTLRGLQKNYHTADFFKSNLYKRFNEIGGSSSGQQQDGI